MTRKPDTREAMRILIDQIRAAIPFHLSAADICRDECRNCSVKLLEYLDSELDAWQSRLDNHEIPDFRDLSRLAKSGHKIYRALQKNGLINEEMSQQP